MASPNYEGVPEIKGRKVTGVGFGPHIFDNGEIILKPTNRGFPPTTVAIVTASDSNNTTASVSTNASAVSRDGRECRVFVINFNRFMKRQTNERIRNFLFSFNS